MPGDRDPGHPGSRVRRRAARLGIFSYIAHPRDLEEMQSAMDVSLQRFAEYHALEGAFGRRAVTERAKGILMERHSIDEQQAFEVLREHARRTNTEDGRRRGIGPREPPPPEQRRVVPPAARPGRVHLNAGGPELGRLPPISADVWRRTGWIVNDPSYKGQRGYNRFLLAIYDPWVLGFMTRAVWKVPVPPGIERYRRLIGRRHLDVGPGNGHSWRRPHRRTGPRSPCSIRTRTCSGTRHAGSRRCTRPPSRRT